MTTKQHFPTYKKSHYHPQKSYKSLYKLKKQNK